MKLEDKWKENSKIKGAVKIIKKGGKNETR